MIKVLLFLFIVSNVFANPCSQVFHGDVLLKTAKDTKLYNTAFFLDGLTKKMKTYSKSIVDIELSLLRGETDLAINKFTHTFRKVESSFLEIERLKKTIRSTDKKDLTLLNQFKKELDYHSKILGNNFEIYKTAKEKFSSLIKDKNCSAKCLKALKRVDRATSILKNGYRGFYKELISKRKKITLKKVKQTLEENPKAFVISKRKIFIDNIARRLFKLFKNRLLIKSLLLGTKVTSKLGRVLRVNSLLRLFKRAYNVRYFTHHQLPITKLAYSSESTAKKISILERDLSGVDLDDFLTDFSRASDSRIQTSFDKMHLHLQQNNPNSILLRRFDEAQKLGVKIGKIGAKKPRNLSWLVGSMVIAGTGYGYFSFEKSSELVEQDLLEVDVDASNDLETIEIEFDSVEDNSVIEEFTEVNESVTALEFDLENP
jgi:hypothetical protein